MKLRQLWIIAGVLLLFNACGNDDSGDSKIPEAYKNPAVAPFTMKIAEHPDDPEAYYERAMALANIQSDSLSIIDFEKAISLDERNLKYIYRYAGFLFEINEMKKAAEQYEVLIRLDPRNEDAILGAIQTFIKLKDAKNAHKYLEPPLKNLPGHPVLTYFTAEIALIENDTAKALAILDQLLKQDNKHYEANFLKAEILAAKNDEGNIRYFERAFAIDTLDALPIEKIGDFYFARKDYNSALKFYKQSVKADINYEFGFYKVGKTYFVQDSLEKALNSYNIALQSNIRFLDAYLGKAEVFERMNLKDSVVNSYKQALIFNPKSEVARKGLERWSK